MIIKEIKEYGTKTKRQRIDFSLKDGFNKSDKVVIVPLEQYNDIKQDILDLQNQLVSKDKDIEIYKSRIEILSNQEEKQESNLQELIKNAIAPIDNHYQKEIEIKNNEIKQLKMQLKTLQAKTNQYNLELMGLSTLDILFRSKHKELIKNYSDEISLIVDDHQVVDVDAPGLPGKKS